ncbi:MAG: hypothetical protein LBC43_01285 [Bifidobacteriaceae bacterium]|jgi:hypothetical protein|nr:hypothetical protein [Bifidobacteriaceae bacterium]
MNMNNGPNNTPTAENIRTNEPLVDAIWGDDYGPPDEIVWEYDSKTGIFRTTQKMTPEEVQAIVDQLDKEEQKRPLLSDPLVRTFFILIALFLIFQLVTMIGNTL